VWIACLLCDFFCCLLLAIVPWLCCTLLPCLLACLLILVNPRSIWTWLPFIFLAGLLVDGVPWYTSTTGTNDVRLSGIWSEPGSLYWYSSCLFGCLWVLCTGIGFIWVLLCCLSGFFAGLPFCYMVAGFTDLLIWMLCVCHCQLLSCLICTLFS
jgi:hypothetical protein